MSHAVRVAVDNLMQSIAPLLSIGFSLAWLRRAGRRLLSPAFLLPIGPFFYGVGQSIWTYYELVLHKQTPFPSWADAGYLLAYPFLFLGVLALPSRPLPAAARVRIFLDSLIGIVGLVTFSWYFVLGPTMLQGGETLVAKIIGTAYPVSDIALLCCVLLVVLRSRGSTPRSVIGLITAGLAAIIVADSIFDYQTLHNTYETGHWIDILWPAGYWMIAIAGRAAQALSMDRCAWSPPSTSSAGLDWHARIERSTVAISERIRNLPSFVLACVPYTMIFAVGLLVWHTAVTRGDEKFEPGVYIGGAVIVCLIFLRQVITLLENQLLAAQLRMFNANLEKQVDARTSELARRTDQLAALQRLTASVNKTLDGGKILSVTARHAVDALAADAVAIWVDHQWNGAGIPDCHVLGELTEDVRRRMAEMKSAESAPSQILEAAGPEAEPVYYVQSILRWQDQVLGKIGVVRRGHLFASDEIDLLRSITGQAASALHNAVEYHRARAAADCDPVTSVLNHRATQLRLDRALNAARDSGTPVTVIMTDLDNFKLFNDTYGHPVGDTVLHRIGQILQEESGPENIVGRYGADEFMLILPGCDADAGLDLAKRLRARVDREPFQYDDAERSIPIGLTFGVASFPRDSDTRLDLLRTVDSNLQMAKSSEERIAGMSEMRRAERELRAHSSFRLLFGLVASVDNKDRYTRAHSEDVTAYALWIAEEIGLSEDDRRSLRIGGLLHDVGKIGIPDEILRKPGKLTNEEFETMKSHPELGALIVGGVPGTEDIIDIVRHHHERWDGRGYPAGLAGEETPLNARILAVADAVSAMTTDRPYRKGLAWDAVIAELRRCSGAQFDPALAEAFIVAASKRVVEVSQPQAEAA